MRKHHRLQLLCDGDQGSPVFVELFYILNVRHGVGFSVEKISSSSSFL